MADEKPDDSIEKSLRQVSLPLRAVGGRVLLTNAKLDGLDRCVIELNCWWSPPGPLARFQTSIRVGDDRHKPLMRDEDGVEVIDKDAEEETGWNLLHCPIVLTLYRAEDGQLAEDAERTEDPILGRFNYRAPIQTDDGVVNELRPPINPWVTLGRTTFDALRDRLVATETPDFDLSITVEFPRGTVETGWSDRRVTWDGEGALPVISATIVWTRGVWETSRDREKRVSRKPETEERESPRAHVELMQAMNRLEAVVVRLAAPLWIAVGAAIIAVVLAR